MTNSLQSAWIFAHSLHQLSKPRVVRLIVFCSWVGMLLSFSSWPTTAQWWLMLIASAGIWLVSGSAAICNCLLEAHLDARMKRTVWRSEALGITATPLVLFWAVVICTLGTGVLYFWVNPLTALLTLATFIGYAYIYTVWLKPRTPQNIVIGGASGAMPPVLGWAAMNNALGAEAWVLFLLVFVWTPPHFWALALYRADEYRSAGLPMLPVTHGNALTRLHIWLYSWVLLGASLLPFAIGMNGFFYLACALILGGYFSWQTWILQRQYSEVQARKTFRASIWYLVLLFASLLVDRLLRS